jgi:hypothetical protein
MDVFDKHENDNLAYTVKVLLNCFSSDNDSATDRLCLNPESVALLALACGPRKEDMVCSVASKQPVR